MRISSNQSTCDDSDISHHNTPISTSAFFQEPAPQLHYFAETPHVSHLGYVFRKFPNASREQIFDEIAKNVDALITHAQDLCFLGANFPEKDHAGAIFSLIVGNDVRFRRLIFRDWNNVILLANRYPLFSQRLVDCFTDAYPGERSIPLWVVREIYYISSIIVFRSGEAESVMDSHAPVINQSTSFFKHSPLISIEKQNVDTPCCHEPFSIETP